jgi:hypothetical protein
MLENSGTALAPEPVGIEPPIGNDPFSFEAVDVTGTQRLLAEDVERDMPTEAVARALAARMRLPENVPWALRLDETSAFLDEQRPIGEQVAPGAQVTVVPKTHLGAGRSRFPD